MAAGLAALALAATLACASAPSAVDVNTAFGLELFSDQPLWEESAGAVAERIGWPLESQTRLDASWRVYPAERFRLLGCRPFSCVLYAENGRPSGLSLVFANKGDSLRGIPGGGNSIRELRKAVEESVVLDERLLGAALENLFGPPVADRFGQGRQTRESVKRWDWAGHAFLLAAPRGDYAALRILPVESADAGGRSRLPDSVVRERLADCVARRSNGDVVIEDLPMVNQGPKGYCVPATWERVLRHMGVPADMYVLAMAAGTGLGGGTFLSEIAAGAREAVVRGGRRFESPSVRPTPAGVSKFIDKGLPVIWALFSTREFNDATNARIADRRAMSSPEDWNKSLQAARKAAKRWTRERSSAHVCLITGYNKSTGEIAISDSWGDAFAERWITAEEAEAVSQGSFQLITF